VKAIGVTPQKLWRLMLPQNNIVKMLNFVAALALLAAPIICQSSSSLAAQATTFNCSFVPVPKPHEIVASCPRELYLGEETLGYNFFYNSSITNQTAVQATILFKLPNQTVIYSERKNFSSSLPIQTVEYTVDPTAFRFTSLAYSTIVELRIVSTADNATFVSTVILPQMEIKSGSGLDSPTATGLGPVATINLVPFPTPSSSSAIYTGSFDMAVLIMTWFL
jgi:hypothetical protein